MFAACLIITLPSQQEGRITNSNRIQRAAVHVMCYVIGWSECWPCGCDSVCQPGIHSLGSQSEVASVFVSLHSLEALSVEEVEAEELRRDSGVV